ncbi:MAG TPA: hypothetical protein VG053_00765 [Solirubrobacteraceae bacterium]|jgi:hypothetical protein|nr:hypothetical protein [Solirubrobacteraceae bacterium]
MLGWLEGIVTAVENIPSYLLYAVETVINLVTEGLDALFVTATSVGFFTLPETFAPPTILGWLNWFFPVAAVVSVATSLVVMYSGFLLVRWVFKKAGVI